MYQLLKYMLHVTLVILQDIDLFVLLLFSWFLLQCCSIIIDLVIALPPNNNELAIPIYLCEENIK
jgi:hypothetical protein